MTKTNRIIFRLFITLVFLWALAMPHFSFAQSAGSGWNVSALEIFNLPKATVKDIITRILNWLLSIFASVGVIGFAISGILYLTAAGDEDQMKRAKQAMQYSIIGVIVGLAGLVAIQAANNLLNATNF